MRKNKKQKFQIVSAAVAFGFIIFFASIVQTRAQSAEQGITDLNQSGQTTQPSTTSSGNSWWESVKNNVLFGTGSAEQGNYELQKPYIDQQAQSPAGSSTYFNQEKIPGAPSTGNFVDYVKQIIRFGFAAIGIVALFMLSVGAYQYLMAASNLAKMENARKTISSALLGLVLGLTAFLILRTINPQLVSLQLTSPGGGTGAGTGISSDKGTNYGNGNCVEVGSGPCSPENLASTFSSAANQASIICNYESQGNQMKASKSDLCQDGRSFSWGLFQINLTQHSIGGLNCPSAFSGKNSSCTVTNESLYQQCAQAAQNPTANINYAKGLYSQNGWGDWKNTRTKCGL